jgi:BirA family biotin operon repressor/biotin-[acetyl-CoA-carboxylase] ligase
MHDHLHVAEVRAALVGTRFAAHIQHFASIHSTNTALLEAAATAPEGMVYIADEQTAGRGRGGHSWHSAPGEGLYLSVLVRPSLRLHDALLLSLATGLAARHAVLETSGLSLDIRWPNDLMLGSKKTGGILVETAVEGGADPWLRYAVIGIGINVHHNAFPPDLQHLATSLFIERGEHPATRDRLVIALLRALDLELTLLEDGSNIPSLLHRLAAISTWISGKRVTVPEQGGYSGTTAGLNPSGYLLVDAEDGSRKTVLSGGVREQTGITAVN